MSSINPNNINILYPIAGQDNDTQGFRNNFRSIKDNFTQASTEITALQGTAARSPQIRYQGDILTNPVDIPASPSALGVKGQIAFDSSHLYVCTSTNNWLALANVNVGSFLSTYTGTVSTTNIISPSGTSGNITINPDGNGDVIFPATTELFIQSGATSANVYSGALVVTGGVGMVGDLNIGGNLLSTGSRIDASFQYNAPTTNFYYSISGNVYRFVLDPTGAITNGTVVLPVTTVNGTIIRVSSTQTITNFQTLPGSGATLVPSANITLTGGTCVEYLYHSTESKWYKVS